MMRCPTKIKIWKDMCPVKKENFSSTDPVVQVHVVQMAGEVRMLFKEEGRRKGEWRDADEFRQKMIIVHTK